MSLARRSALALCVLALLAGRCALGVDVDGYRVLFAECRPPQCERPLLILRSFVRSGEATLLAVDPQTLATRFLPAAGLDLKARPWAELRAAAQGTPYAAALADAEQRSSAEHDAGIVHTLPPGNGVVLTVDLCPSPHPLDRRLFAAILSGFAAQEKPVPLGIAITGRWMREHPDDLRWLAELERDHGIAVTWINHTFNHPYSKNLPDSENFLRRLGINLDTEVLGNEVAMISSGLRPSVFFRFPGLVSDPELVARVVAYGLIPVGSDAWLAKNQRPGPGSIVLVHGNGNEPIGVDRFLQLIAAERSSIRDRNWLLFDLRESVSRLEGAK